MEPETPAFPTISRKWIALAAALGVAALGVGVVAARAVARSDGSLAAVITSGGLPGREGQTRGGAVTARASTTQAAQAANQRRLERMLGVGSGGVAAPVVMPVDSTESRSAGPSSPEVNAEPLRVRDVVRESEAVNLVRSHGSLGSCVEVARRRNPGNLRGRARLVIHVVDDGRLRVEVLDAPDEHLGSCIERGANALHMGPGAAVTAETVLDLE